jgi:hypothetical protein
MGELADQIRTNKGYFTDDTLRTINLFVRALAAAESPPAKRRAVDHNTPLGDTAHEIASGVPPGTPPRRPDRHDQHNS